MRVQENDTDLKNSLKREKKFPVNSNASSSQMVANSYSQVGLSVFLLV